jgi:hypothetical protein
MELRIINEIDNGDNSSKNSRLDSTSEKAHENLLHFFMFAPGPL